TRQDAAFDLLKQLYLIASKVVRGSITDESRTLFFDLQRVLHMPENEMFDRRSTLEALINTLGGAGGTALDIFRQLLRLRERGILEDITMVIKKHRLPGVMLYDALS